MAPLICLVISFVIFRSIGLIVPYFADWHTALRAALGIMFLLTASAHWGKRRPDLIRMVPRGFRSPGSWVTLTGIAEIALSIGLQFPHVARWAAGTGAIMLCCLFPANIKAAHEHLTILNRPVMSVMPRLLVQLIFIGALVASVWHR